MLTYLLQDDRSTQSLHAQDFNPIHRVLDRASKASGLGDKAPEAEEYLSNKDEI